MRCLPDEPPRPALRLARRGAADMAAPLIPCQVRGARGLLGWSMVDLARAARVSVSTVKRLEAGERTLPTGGRPSAVRAALEAAGIRFMDDGEGGFGVFRRGGDRGAPARADGLPPSHRHRGA